MQNPEKKKSFKWIPAVIFLLIANPSLLVLAIPAGVFGGIIWLAIQAVKKNQGTASKSDSPARYTTRQEKFDNCSQPVFCRHTDKSEHHVRRGKEIDPWDRPDIDISKYQRNR